MKQCPHNARLKCEREIACEDCEIYVDAEVVEQKNLQNRSSHGKEKA